jgi:hypothetical protein
MWAALIHYNEVKGLCVQTAQALFIRVAELHEETLAL